MTTVSTVGSKRKVEDADDIGLKRYKGDEDHSAFLPADTLFPLAQPLLASSIPRPLSSAQSEIVRAGGSDYDIGNRLRLAGHLSVARRYFSTAILRGQVAVANGAPASVEYVSALLDTSLLISVDSAINGVIIDLANYASVAAGDWPLVTIDAVRPNIEHLFAAAGMIGDDKALERHLWNTASALDFAYGRQDWCLQRVTSTRVFERTLLEVMCNFSMDWGDSAAERDSPLDWTNANVFKSLRNLIGREICGNFSFDDKTFGKDFYMMLTRQVFAAVREFDSAQDVGSVVKPHRRTLHFEVLLDALTIILNHILWSELPPQAVPVKNRVRSIAHRAIYKLFTMPQAKRQPLLRISAHARASGMTVAAYLAWANYLAPNVIDQWHVDFAEHQPKRDLTIEVLRTALLERPSSVPLNEALVNVLVLSAFKSLTASRMMDRLNAALVDVQHSLFFVGDGEAAKLSAALLVHGQELVTRFQVQRGRAKLSPNTSLSRPRDEAIALVLHDCEQFKDELARGKQRADDRAAKKAAIESRKKESIGNAIAQVAQALGDDESRDLSCVVCLSDPRSVCCVPCAHLALCTNCAPKVDTCPVCRAPITQKMVIKIA
jgi:hypothetical protein